MTVEGKTAVVFGGTRGIGHSICNRFHDRGAHVFAVGKVAPPDPLGDDIGYFAGTKYADVAIAEEVSNVLEQIAGPSGAIDIVINCAGLFSPSTISKDRLVDADDIRRLIDVNVLGTWNVIERSTRYLARSNSGRIINISSVAAAFGVRGYSVYCATKAAVSMMTRAAALELAPLGISINAIAPGNTKTEMNEHLRSDPNNARLLADIQSRTPSGIAFAEPDDLAEVALFLASAAGSVLQGAVILADGGLSIGL
jgi:3-oxoacyl-[acyl-carrier protein] reductase